MAMAPGVPYQAASTCNPMTAMSLKAKAFITVTVGVGLALLLIQLARWECPDPARYR